MKCKKKFLLTILSTLLVGGLVGCTAVDDFDDEENEVIPEDKYYLLTFNNSDKSFLFSSYVKEGDYSLESVYKGNLPSKADDSLYTYTFNGWENESTRYEHSQVIHVNKDYSFTALYTSNLIVYHTVQFVNWDDELLYEVKVKDGEDATYEGDVPTRPNSDGNAYTFFGWNKETTNITADTIIVAQYSSERERYRVRYLNYDGSILDIQYVYYGDGVQYTGEIPTKPAEGEYEYTFSGWDKESAMVTGDIDFIAQYESSYRTLVVTFINYDGSKLYETTTTYGGSVEYDSELPDPTRPPEGRNAYEFSGWNVPLDKVYANIEVKAQYNTVARGATEGLLFDYDMDVDGYCVSGYEGSDTDIYIPKTYGDYQVKGISYGAFQSNNSITSIFVEDNVTYIDSYAFAYCNNLKTLRLSQKLRSLGDYVFAQTAIQNMVLPSTLETISESTFYNFEYADKVTTDSKNIYLKIENTFIFNKEKTVLKGTIVSSGYYENHSKITIPEGVEEIAANVFCNNTYIKEVVLPSTLKTIGEYAFYCCYNINDINFKDATSLKTIERYAFYNCDYVEEIEFCSSLETIGEYAFSNIDRLKSIVFDDSPTSIDRYAFAWCFKLETIDFGNQIKVIEYDAFADCDQIKEVTLPETVTNVSYDAFWDCNSLETITIGPNNSIYYSMDGVLFIKDTDEVRIYPRGKTGTFKISADFAGEINNEWANYGFTSIEIDANNPYYCSVDGIVYSKDKTKIIFGACCGKDVVIPATVTSLSEGAFQYARNLETVDLSKANITTLPRYCFYGCDQLKGITIPSNITTIGDYCFDDCDSESFTTINVPNTVTTIGYGCFRYMPNLTTVTLGTNITSIPEYCFESCPNLNSITFNGTVTSFGYEAFRNTGFTSFTFPNSVITVGSYCFSSCTKLTKVVLSDSLPVISSECFSYCSSLVDVNIPASVTSLNYGAFRVCSSLKSINIPDSVTSLDSSCFYSCTSLETASIGNGLTELSSSTFQLCSSLKSVQIGSNVKYIRSSCFSGCSSLTSVNIPYGLQSISSSAFYNCSTLRSLYLPSTITSISDGAFAYCSNLVIFSSMDTSTWSGSYWSEGALRSYENVNGGYRADDNIVYTLSKTNVASATEYLGNESCVTIKSKVTINSSQYNITTVNGLFGMMCPSTVILEEGITTIASYSFPSWAVDSKIVIPKSIESIAPNSYLDNLSGVYYNGTKTEFDNAELGSHFTTNFPNLSVYYYSATKPSTEDVGKISWRYVDGIPTVWTA